VLNYGWTYPFSKGVTAAFLVSLNLVVLRIQRGVIRCTISCSAGVSGYFYCTDSCLTELNLSEQRLIFCKESHNRRFGFVREISHPAGWRPQGPWAGQVDVGFWFQLQPMSPPAWKPSPSPSHRVIFPVAKQPLAGRSIALIRADIWTVGETSGKKSGLWYREP